MDTGTLIAQLVSATATMDQAAESLYLLVQPTCKRLALMFIPPVITVAMMFLGVKIALRQPFVDQFVKFTITVIVAFLVVQLEWPQKMMIGYQKDLTEGFKGWAGDVFALSGGDTAGDPLKSWYQWMGEPNFSTSSPAPSGVSKFSVNEIYRLFGINLPNGIMGTSSGDDLADRYDDMYNLGGGPRSIQQALASMDSGWMLKLAVTDDFLTLPWIELRFSTDPLKLHNGSEFLQLVCSAMFCLVFGPMVLSMITTVAMIKGGVYILPLMNQIALLVGAKYAFLFSVAFGIIFVPLMFLPIFKDIWVKYLQWCLGLMLIPCFYFLLSGIGYHASTKIFSELVVNTRLGELVRTLFFQTFFVAGVDLLPWLNISLQLFALGVVLLMSIFSLYAVGCSVVAAIVAGGVSFAALSSNYAKAWVQSFATDGVQENMANLFNAINSALSSATGQGAGQGVSMLSGVASGLMSKASST